MENQINKKNYIFIPFIKYFSPIPKIYLIHFKNLPSEHIYNWKDGHRKVRFIQIKIYSIWKYMPRDILKSKGVIIFEVDILYNIRWNQQRKVNSLKIKQICIHVFNTPGTKSAVFFNIVQKAFGPKLRHFYP